MHAASLECVYRAPEIVIRCGVPSWCAPVLSLPLPLRTLLPLHPTSSQPPTPLSNAPPPPPPHAPPHSLFSVQQFPCCAPPWRLLFLLPALFFLSSVVGGKPPMSHLVPPTSQPPRVLVSVWRWPVVGEGGLGPLCQYACTSPLCFSFSLALGLPPVVPRSCWM